MPLNWLYCGQIREKRRRDKDAEMKEGRENKMIVFGSGFFFQTTSCSAPHEYLQGSPNIHRGLPYSLIPQTAPVSSPATHHTCVNKRKLVQSFFGGLQLPMSPKSEQTTLFLTFLRSSKWLDLTSPTQCVFISSWCLSFSPPISGKTVLFLMFQPHPPLLS